MPTYDYVCRACGHEFEEFQMMSDGVLRKCPSCSKLKLERLIGGGAGFVFKGSGYYVTDYRSKSYDDAKKADSAPAAGDSGSGDSKKPATPPKTEKAPAKPKKDAKS